MIIREAKPEDIFSIVNFQIAMAKETEGIELHLPTVELGVKAVLNDASKGRYYVTEVNDEIIGSLLTTYEWSDWRNGTVLWIQSVYIKPDFRRKGVYRNMYSYLKHKVLEDEKLKGIRLYAEKSNISAHKTYKKLGMNPEHYTTFEWLK
ncbi:GNAT family N-acetyltransferase [Maribellus maritimus]|uniref:GNAT family N-acetyltransferase n=1 Tax=Maribellus maritimus TaxID=2870838 RepID=UPI001EE9F9E9|nr:GNAT family N-acetyltransferase [Maribellus maritimus]MCG6187935.1 GNAT family N-acetyltransferase [Maribellus maritimus]